MALGSLVAPDASARILYAERARNLLMYAMNQAALGTCRRALPRSRLRHLQPRQRLRRAVAADRGLDIQRADARGNPILTASDKATIRNVFMMWANDCLNANTTGGDHPSPSAWSTACSSCRGDQPYRMASNNYYLGHARLLTMMALSIDPGDDPPVNGSAAASKSATRCAATFSTPLAPGCIRSSR